MASSEEVTGEFSDAIAPTEPASLTPEGVVQAPARGNAVPLALYHRFENIRRIGAGGMGVVYRALDRKLGREVVLKLIRHGDPAFWPRIVSEARAQARVEHDHICRVYEVGEADGEPFIVMQFIDGQPFFIARERMNLRERVSLLQKVAIAIHAAHSVGLIHRDIKPGNILVEEEEDGSFRPYVVDFGIASVVEGGVAETLQGVLGTPAYLAPEVAMHRDRKVVDVRVDIYGLGATLYDALGGRAPFVGADALDILAKLGREDAPPLRAIAKKVPMELEAIVMKAIDREPNRRYGTMAALADDLQRFLDGEPIMARRVGLVYATRRFIRKRARTLLVGAIVLAALLAVGITRRNAAIQANLAEDLGRTVSEMELYMRTAYQMPPHDIERERRVIREGIKTLEKRISDSGPVRDAAVYYALGRAYLTLGDFVRACDYLEKAKAAGYTSQELIYALARARFAAYDHLKTRVEQYGTDPKQIKVEVEAIEAQYKKPALELLHSAESARIEAPMYALALGASWDEKLEEAVEKAHAAFVQAPLLYEAKLIEGNALGEIATRHWHSGKSDWWQSMSAGMETALEALAAAENIARSDPSVLQAICGTRTRLMYAAFSSKKVPMLPYYEAAREACNRLVIVDPSSPAAQMSRASLHALYAYAVARLDEPEGDPIAATEEAIRIATEAKRISHGGLPAYQSLGTAWVARGRLLLDRGQPATAALEAGEQHFNEARRIFRYNESLQDGQINVQYLRTMDDRRHGVDIARRVKTAEVFIAEAIADHPESFNGHLKQALINIEEAKQQQEWGQLPEKLFDNTLQTVTAAKKINPAFTFVYLDADVYEITARHAIDAGTSAQEAFEQLAKSLETLRAEESETVQWLEYTGIEAMLRAEEAIQRGKDPQPFVDSARKAFHDAMKRSPQLVCLGIEAAQVELIAAKMAMAQKSATYATFAKVRAPLQLFLSNKLEYPDAHAVVAGSHALAAVWRASRNESPEEDIKTGLEMVSRAIAANPKFPRAWIIRGQLFLTRAHATKDALTRTEAAKTSAEAFQEAFRLNPWLERQYVQSLHEAQQM